MLKKNLYKGKEKYNLLLNKIKNNHLETCYFYGLKDHEYFKITRQLFDLEWEGIYSENLTSFQNVKEELLNLPIINQEIKKIIVIFYLNENEKILSLKVIGKFSQKSKSLHKNMMFT